ncbi:hypothetical protein [Methylibium sp.]|uniref:hypothetical protein n=1 Tax=Methylibium sp. TaxID=2067992 RepID=UPI001837A292|nr:hypothetical protein [Methylibium sp.]MBA3591656.1 hypothetical protein [Methylibium sp.]
MNDWPILMYPDDPEDCAAYALTSERLLAVLDRIKPNPLAAMCSHKDAHSREWTEPAPSTAKPALAGLGVEQAFDQRLGAWKP